MERDEFTKEEAIEYGAFIENADPIEDVLADIEVASENNEA